MRDMKKRALLAGLLILVLPGSPAMAVEEPPFTTVSREGDFEIRDYPALVAAEVTVAGDQSEAASRGFRLLAGYIFGGNGRRQTIAMTAPVAQTPTPGAGSKAWIVRFTMPKAYALGALPPPNDPRVRLTALSPARLAVIRFSGLATRANVAARTVQLTAFIKARHLTAAGPASLAQYDPPWTPWFMRRNEVMLPVRR
jgi:hypothetical protein